MPDKQSQSYYMFATSNIMIRSDKQTVSPKAQELLGKLEVFLATMDGSLKKKKKTLNDYDAMSTIMLRSGDFIETDNLGHHFDSTTHSVDVSLKTSILQTVLGMATNPVGGSLEMAQNILGTFGADLNLNAKSTDVNKSSNVAHLVMQINDAMGIVVIAVKLYYASSAETTSLRTVESSDSSVSTFTEAIKFDYHVHNFLFVDPTMIDKFVKSFEGSKEQEKIMDKWSKEIPDKTSEAPQPKGGATKELVH